MVACPLEVFSFLAQEILTLSMDAFAEISTGNGGWTSLGRQKNSTKRSVETTYRKYFSQIDVGTESKYHSS